MRYITEQELQFQYRQKKLSELVLNSDERLTPGAQQFLNDHQIAIVKNISAESDLQLEAENFTTMASTTKSVTLFPLLEIELWEAAVKAAEVNTLYKEKIITLALLTKRIALEDLPENDHSTEDELDMKISEVELSASLLSQPTAKIILKLQRADIYAATLQTCVTPKQKVSLMQLSTLIKKLILQLANI